MNIFLNFNFDLVLRDNQPTFHHCTLQISKEPEDTPLSEQSEVLSLKGEAEMVLKKEEEIYSKSM